MKRPTWHPVQPYSWGFLTRVTVKTLLLFVLANVLFAISNPIPQIGRLSIYNWLVPGRERLPYGESQSAYNLSLNNLDAMFASHQIATPKSADEYRVLVMGDSSVWGMLLDNPYTLTGYLNAANLRTDHKVIKTYNLGHPIMSVTKDLLLLDYAVRYQPDLIIWIVTLESLPYAKQLEAPLVQRNPALIRKLIDQYDLKLDAHDPRFIDLGFEERTLIGQRRELADWWRLQLYGINWSATGIDQIYKDYEPRSNDFANDTQWQNFSEEDAFEDTDIALDVLNAGTQLADSIPTLIINEPIYIADGLNSEVRYNLWYPKWAYDRYRHLMRKAARQYDWQYLDVWNSILPTDFTDSPVHLTSEGSRQLSILVGDAIRKLANSN